jgi:hypothetical protein
VNGNTAVREPAATVVWGRHAWWACALRSLDRPTLGRCPRCCRCPGRCDHPEHAEVDL